MMPLMYSGRSGGSSPFMVSVWRVKLRGDVGRRFAMVGQ